MNWKATAGAVSAMALHAFAITFLCAPQAQGPHPAHGQWKITINGRAVPALPGDGFREPLIPLTLLCSALNAKLGTVRGLTKALQLTSPDKWCQLELNSKNIRYRGEDGKHVLDLLPERPLKRNGAIWVPVSTANFLGAAVTRSGKSIEITNESDEGIAAWKRLLGLPATLVPTGRDFAISRLDIRPDAGLLEGSEAVVNLSVSRSGFVQIYEVNSGQTDPLISLESDTIIFYPLHIGLKPIPVPIAARMRIPIRTTRAGVFWYIVLATSERQQSDLLETFRKGMPNGEWDIKGQRIEVKARSAQ